MLRSFQCAEQGGEASSGKTVAVSSAPSETSCILAFFGWDMTPPSRSPPTAIYNHRAPSSRGLLTCSLCQRQIPTWNFFSSTTSNQVSGSSDTRQRQVRAFDVLREHRTHCPYVVKTTPSPSLAPVLMSHGRKGGSDVWDMALSPSMELLEGWSVHLNILLRSEWRRISGYTSLGGIASNPIEGPGENPAGGIIRTVRTQHGGVSP